MYFLWQLMFVIIVDKQGILEEIVLNPRREGKQSKELWWSQQISLDRKWVLEKGLVEVDRGVAQVDPNNRGRCLL